jgi:hypothetical protein
VREGLLERGDLLKCREKYNTTRGLAPDEAEHLNPLLEAVAARLEREGPDIRDTQSSEWKPKLW